jgi:hypothetical protein
MKFLTKEELEKLPEGTIVDVIWCGGNITKKLKMKKDTFGNTCVIDSRGFTSSIHHAGSNRWDDRFYLNKK